MFGLMKISTHKTAINWRNERLAEQAQRIDALAKELDRLHRARAKGNANLRPGNRRKGA